MRGEGHCHGIGGVFFYINEVFMGDAFLKELVNVANNMGSLLISVIRAFVSGLPIVLVDLQEEKCFLRVCNFIVEGLEVDFFSKLCDGLSEEVRVI